MENRSYGEIIGSSHAPYINGLARGCGSAANFYAEGHPSLPNYLAMTSGSTHGVSDDGAPDKHPLAAASIFSVLSGGASRSLQESMPSNCLTTNAGDYVAKHNPQTYYTNARADCSRYDVPLGNSPDLSARFTFVTPNLVNDMHDGTIEQGDAWLAKFLPQMFSSAEYRAGRTAVFLTWDEDNEASGNHIATLVIAPSVVPGTKATARFDHYAMLRSTEEMLGVRPLLGSAASAADLRRAFNL
jgi:hypothetical protein